MTKGVRALKRFRFENDLTQEVFSIKYGFKRGTIAGIEAGTTPLVKTAKRIAKIIKIDWSLFFEEEEVNCNVADS